jgi:DNA modification methylase
MIDLRLGDCIEILKTLPDNSVDSIVTDPPYGLSFMGKKWDYDVPSVEIWEECLRVLKPGGHLLSFGGPRTYHRLASGIEDAGFEIRDQIMWVFGSGFPKSHNIGKAIDKRKEWDKYEVFSNSLKSKREELGLSKRQAFDKCGFEAETFGGNSWYEDGRIPSTKDYELLKSGLELGNDFDTLFEEVEREFISNESNWGKEGFTKVSGYGEWIKTKGNGDYEGWGTALKPAHEPICMARKPLSEKSIAENVMKHGTGGINIDGCRIEIGEGDRTSAGHRTCNIFETEKISGGNGSPDYETHEQGRFPANIIFDEEAGQLLDQQSGVSKGAIRKPTGNKEYNQVAYGKRGDVDTIRGHNDKGGASRFFYCPKAAKSDRDEGLDNFEEKAQRVTSGGTRDFNARCASCGKKFVGSKSTICDCDNPITDNQVFKKKNNHPTVKPTDLMRYLINLVTPPNGTILDPFMGSGSTGKAAVRCGLNFIGIEKEQEYMDIASARIEHEKNKPVQTKLF